MKQGGTTSNTNSKKGMSRDFACKYCNRKYAIAEHKNRHEKQCEEYMNGCRSVK